MKALQFCILLIGSLALISCHTDGSKSSIEINGLTELEQSKVFTPVSVEYDENSKKLNIGQVTISEGFPGALSKVPAPKDEKTYINNSVTNQYFFSSAKSKSNILTHYKSLGSKLGWKEVKSLSNDSNLVFETSKTSGEKIRISVNETIPTNLNALKLSGIYVEVAKE